jgi:hypothetical protein
MRSLQNAMMSTVVVFHFSASAQLATSYPYGYFAYYGWPYYFQGPVYRPAPAYSDPYVGWRPYSDAAGPRASGHVGY